MRGSASVRVEALSSLDSPAQARRVPRMNRAALTFKRYYAYLLPH
ncbi:hypothetical protein PA257_0958 [Pseudomonas aeruginosa]|nr:hypothetical protein CSB94_0719 [Pseudomonas aeruginosa]AWF67390.1 hypothetical protein CSC27_7019 [Pseudomonas aeruginosa]RAL81373.1 hypothetical protein CSC34_4505 [Pseudomonas aeruginosa]BAQ37578.1 hypothetical protein PA257_0958 [Pseudomonas aeruginosa]